MHSMKSEPQTETAAAERLPWHKPAIERLVVSLDTRYNEGSNTDGYGGSSQG